MTMRPSEPVLAAPANSDKRSLWRRVFSFPVLLGVLVAAGGYMASSWGGNPGGKCLAEDPWSHLVIGGKILQSHTWPHADTFSFTSAGVPWIAYEWLAEVPMGLVWN